MPASSRFSTGSLKGRMIGSVVCSTFGAVWMYQALYFGNIATPVWLTVISILTMVLIVCPVIQICSYSSLKKSDADRAFWAAIAKPYWINFAIEWVLCSVAAYWLAHSQRYDLIPHFLGVIIGVHFLPLGKLFRLPLYYATGAVMVVGVLATLAIPAGYVRNIAACGIDGLALWATAAVLLGQDWLSSNEL
jgi:uncharacterized membrane protein (UPF0182 family)